MSSFRRIYVSFVILFDILGFGIVFVIMSNASAQDDLMYLADGDGVFVTVIALIGVFANIGLASVLWLGSLAARRRETQDRPERRARITGE